MNYYLERVKPTLKTEYFVDYIKISTPKNQTHSRSKFERSRPIWKKKAFGVMISHYGMEFS